MSLFVFNPFRASEELLPSVLRKPKQIAWLRVLLTPLKYICDLLLKDYFDGVVYNSYNNATTYYKYQRITWTDNGVYELRVTSSVGVLPTGSSLSATNWRKILDTYIGLNERVKYNSQIIILEHAINKHFKVTAPPYIYFQIVPTGATSITCAAKVPLALFNSLGANNVERQNRVLNFTRKYTIAGYQDNVSTF
jgi:hypothetical protein